MIMNSKISVKFPPKNLDSVVWRYMTMENFEKMLLPYQGDGATKENCLYLHRSDLYPDKLEGTFPEKMVFKESAFSRRNVLSIYEPYFKQTHFVSCWTIRDEEVLKMWETFGRVTESIVVKTTFRKLVDSLDPVFGYEVVKIKYDDHFQTEVSGYYPKEALSIKDEEFHDEKEVRIIANNPFGHSEQPPLDNVGTWERPDGLTGTIWPISAEELIDEIRIHPRAKEGFLTFVRNVLSDAGLSKNVNLSELTEQVKVKPLT